MAEQTTRPLTVASFNQYLAEGRLMGSRCPDCGQTYLPPRAICPGCHCDCLEWDEMPQEGKLAAFTSVYVGPSAMVAEGYDRNNPYVTGIVELAGGAKISARILGVDAKNPSIEWIGRPVSATFVEKGEGDAKTVSLAFEAS
jgi:uncharacterized OB-fold protein